MVGKVASGLYIISRLGARVTGAILIVIAFLITIETLLRKFLSTSIGGVDELSSYSLALVVAWGSAYALFEKSHIRVDTLLLLLPRSVVTALDFVALIVFIFFIGTVNVAAFRAAEESFAFESRSAMGLPLVVPQALWATGFTLFVLSGVLLLVQSAMAVMVGDLDKQRRLIGSASMSESVKEELKQVQRELGKDR